MDPFESVRDFIQEAPWLRYSRGQETRDVLRALDLDTARALVAYGLGLHDEVASNEPHTPMLHGTNTPGLELVLWLAQIRPDACGGLPEHLWRRHVYGPGVLYRGADAATRDAVLAEVDASLATLYRAFPDLVARPFRWNDRTLDKGIRARLRALGATAEWPRVNVGLRMLAWIGDGPVRQWFASVPTALPNLDSLFYRSMSEYASEGGWEAKSGGGRRDLFFSVAYQLVTVEMVADVPSERESDKIAVAVMTAYEDRCRWCGRRLTALLDLDLRHPAMGFLGLAGKRLRIVMCEECSLWSQLFFDVDLLGRAEWSAFTGQKPETTFGPDDGRMVFTPVDHQLTRGPRCASPFEVVARGDQPDVSQLGGMPGWVQDAEYVMCPACQRRMMVVGQVAPEAITNRAIDGVLYGLLCLDCLCSTVIYQCT